MFFETASLAQLNREQREQLAVINRQMIQGVEALWRDLEEAGRAAGRDDDGQRLDYYLTHKRDA